MFQFSRLPLPASLGKGDPVPDDTTIEELYAIREKYPGGEITGAMIWANRRDMMQMAYPELLEETIRQVQTAAVSREDRTDEEPVIFSIEEVRKRILQHTGQSHEGRRVAEG
ncbi:MAG: hypothetical protein PHW10_02520 [Candidatus Peribacteraceae bacterium]|nr:hypothetical protein [Candidatus Peribacteraceae bacterium]